VHFEGPTARGAEEFVHVVRQVLVDPAYRPGFGFLRDRRGRGVAPTEVVHQIADVLKRVSALPPSKMAFVVDPGADYGMMRMMQILTDGGRTEVAVYFDVAEAIRWLTASADVPAVK
jgi:hypothetical protein